MSPSPPRRWFQFRLSTWFVLVVILGGTFWIESVLYQQLAHRFRDVERTQRAQQLDQIGSGRKFGREPSLPHRRFIVQDLLNMALFWPVLVLVVFMAFKLAWAVGGEAERVLAEKSGNTTNPLLQHPRS